MNVYGAVALIRDGYGVSLSSRVLDWFNNGLKNYYYAFENGFNILKSKGALDSLLQYHQEKIHNSSNHVKNGLKTFEVQNNSANSYSNIGNILKAKGQLDEAILYHKRALSMRSSLVGRGENDEELQRKIATSYNNVADILKLQGKNEEALEYYKAASELLYILLEDNEYNYEMHSSLRVSLWNIAVISNDYDSWEKVMVQLQRMKELDLLEYQHKALIDRVYLKMQKVKKKKFLFWG